MLGPIFVREGLTAPRRPSHYLARGLFLGTTWVLLLTVWQTTVGWDRTPTMGDLARFGLLGFRIVVTVQLGLLLFFSALSAASTIAQEKDRRTFLLLLITDLRNREIVLGKVLGALLPIGVMLAGTAPVLMLLMLLGGVAPFQVGQAMAVLTSAALAAGALGGLVALAREKTFQSLAMTVLVLVLYLSLAHGVGYLPFASETVRWWQGTFDPLTALGEAVDPIGAGDGWTAPYRFAVAMLALGAALNFAGIAMLRVWNPSGEPIIAREGEADLASEKSASVHAAPGAVRPVGNNPILWREVATRAYGRRPLLVKFAYFAAVGLIVYSALTAPDAQTGGGVAAAQGLVPVAVLSLLLISAQSVTSITSERDLGAFDLLMVTDLSPNEFVFGKIGGILYNAKEYLIPPFALIAVYAARGQLATPATGLRNLEAGVALALALAVLMAFTVTLGVHVAIRSETSRLAIAHSLGTVFFLTVGTLLCIYLILINGRFEYQWLSFSAFLFLGIGGLWWVLCGDKPSAALTLASWLAPLAIFYTVTNLLIGKPGGQESSDPLIPLFVTGGAFGFAVAAMLVPLLGAFDVAVGRTSGGAD